MGFFKKKKKGLCPECGNEIENINDNFCSNCGWKISKFKAIKTRIDKESELKTKSHNKNAEKHKQEFKQSIHELKNLKQVNEKPKKEIKSQYNIKIKQKTNETKKPPKKPIFKKEINNPSREEAEKQAEEIRKQIDEMDNLGFKKPNEKKYPPFMKDGKVYFESYELDLDIGGRLNDALDEGIARKYGSQEEIEQIEKRKKLRARDIEEKHKFDAKVDEARKYVYGVEVEKGIQLFKEIIEESDMYTYAVANAYLELPYAYIHNNEYDKAIAVCKEEIEVLKHFGEDYSGVESRMKGFEKDKVQHKILRFEREGHSKYYATEFNEAIYPLEKSIELGSTDYKTFKFLSDIYIRNMDLESAINVLNIGIDRIEKSDARWKDTYLQNDRNEGLKDILVNVNHKIETGKFKIDCLPVDENKIAPKIKEAKAILKDDDKEKGIELLEDIMANGTFNNTVYNTLYQTYKKDKKYDDCIRVCEKAIEVLGFFSNDRFEKWSHNLNKSVELKEKNSS